MQNVLVLAIAQNFNTFTSLSNTKMTYSDITLSVTIEEAMMLTQARLRTRLTCILRAPGSTDRINSDKLFPMTCSALQSGMLKKLDAERRKFMSDKKAIKTGKPTPVKVGKNEENTKPSVRK